MKKRTFSRSEYFPLRINPISRSYIIQGSKQEFMQLYYCISFGKVAGAFIRAGTFIMINTYFIMARTISDKQLQVRMANLPHQRFNNMAYKV